MANLAVGGPLGKHHLADELRADPVRRFCQFSLWRRIEGAALLLDRIQLAPQLERGRVREAGADLAAKHQPACPPKRPARRGGVVTDEQCANAGTRSLRI